MKTLKQIAVFYLSVLIILLPGCSLLGMAVGKPVDILMFTAEVEDLKDRLSAVQAAVKKADANNDGKLTLTEGLVGAGGILTAAITGTNMIRNRARRQRGERVDAGFVTPPAG